MKYVTPEMEIMKFNMNDIVCESDPTMGEGGDEDLGGVGGGVVAPPDPW